MYTKHKTYSKEELTHEMFECLIQHFPMSKVLAFWSHCNLGDGDYLAIKDKLFEGKTKEEILAEAKAIEAKREKVNG